MKSGKDNLGIDTLIENLRDAEQVVRLHAATVLGSMGEEPGASLPVLTSLFQTGDEQDRRLTAVDDGDKDEDQDEDDDEDDDLGDDDPDGDDEDEDDLDDDLDEDEDEDLDDDDEDEDEDEDLDDGAAEKGDLALGGD